MGKGGKPCHWALAVEVRWEVLCVTLPSRAGSSGAVKITAIGRSRLRSSGEHCHRELAVYRSGRFFFQNYRGIRDSERLLLCLVRSALRRRLGRLVLLPFSSKVKKYVHVQGKIDMVSILNQYFNLQVWICSVEKRYKLKWVDVGLRDSANERQSRHAPAQFRTTKYIVLKSDQIWSWYSFWNINMSRSIHLQKHREN